MAHFDTFLEIRNQSKPIIHAAFDAVVSIPMTSQAYVISNVLFKDKHKHEWSEFSLKINKSISDTPSLWLRLMYGKRRRGGGESQKQQDRASVAFPLGVSFSNFPASLARCSNAVSSLRCAACVVRACPAEIIGGNPSLSLSLCSRIRARLG